MLDATIVFVANNDNEYRLTIKKANIDDQYKQLYLLDLSEKKTILLENETTVYNFSANSAGVPSLRFAISDNPDGLTQNGLSSICFCIKQYLICHK
jgi:uncharacterized protein YccT (UPF0319 family)